MASFEAIFQSDNRARDKFLSRYFGLLSEDLVRQWCRRTEAVYEDLGRPTLYAPGEQRGSTLDFTLRHRATGKTFVAELKCELEYENYRYLRLSEPGQLGHHTSTAFKKLLTVASHPHALESRVAAKPLHVDGAILIWGATTPQGREAVMHDHGFADVLSVEEMLVDLHRWGDSHWQQRVAEVRVWTEHLLTHLS